MKRRIYLGMAILAALCAFSGPAFSAPDSIQRIKIQESQKRVIAEHLKDQIDKYTGQGKYLGQGAWGLDRIKADLRNKLQTSQNWFDSHFSFHLRQAQAKVRNAEEAEKAKAFFEKQQALIRELFEVRLDSVDQFDSEEAIIYAHEREILDLGRSDNYLFIVTDHAVSFDGTFVDSMLLFLTVPLDLALLPIEFFVSLFTGF